jgi:hypothetical protein
MPLPVAFWRYGVAWSLFINSPTSLLTMFAVLADAPVWLLVPVHLLPTPYNLLALVGVWRSAARYDGPQKWADLARTAIVIGMAVLTVT